ncbi:MAG TPA: FHA domain-containing protein [Longimicrobium sp.]|nr:FHA domain-containing protein [Longimicrobium sp.]
MAADAGTTAPGTDATTPEAPPADAAAATTAAGGPLSGDRIQLVGESGRPVTVGVRTPIGKHVVRQFGDDANVFDAEQFVLERGADGNWQIVPAEGTTNETLVNGEPVTAPRPLKDGDVIAVGRAAKGIARLPLTVRSA